MSFGQGDVVVAADPFGHAPRRPYLVVSNDGRPFQGEDYLVAGITTTEREASLPLVGNLERGRLDRPSFVSPWTVLTIRHEHVGKRVAVASLPVVRATVDAVAGYLSVESPED